MYKYIVLFKFRDPEACIPTAIEKLHAMMGKIPEIKSMETGADVWHNGQRSYDLCLTCTFESLADIDIYDKHPLHQDAREYIYAHRLEGKIVVYEMETARHTDA